MQLVAVAVAAVAEAEAEAEVEGVVQDVNVDADGGEVVVSHLLNLHVGAQEGVGVSAAWHGPGTAQRWRSRPATAMPGERTEVPVESRTQCRMAPTLTRTAVTVTATRIVAAMVGPGPQTPLSGWGLAVHKWTLQVRLPVGVAAEPGKVTVLTKVSWGQLTL